MAMFRRYANPFRVGAMCSVLLFAIAQGPAQSVAPREFEVAAVKPSNAEITSSSGIKTGYGQLHAENVTLQRCIMGAYAVGPHQISGGADWVNSERFDILAKTEQPIDDDSVLMTMLQSLLADRFKLALHRETRMMPAYILEAAKNGPKLEKSESGEATTNTSSNSTTVTLNARNIDMDHFAKVLARSLDRPVVNQTGLAGIYNIKLHWARDSAALSSQATADEVSIFTAIQEQLGLHLRADKALVEMLVIDHVEKPSEN